MENYEKPEMEVVDLEGSVILTSGCDVPGDDNEGGMMGDCNPPFGDI